MRRLFVLGLFAAACTQDPTLVNPATFERPGDVAFACFNTNTGGYVELENCAESNLDSPYSMTALVTQTASGEVGAIDLRLNRTLDSDVRVPGYTFVRVGEVPSALVVPPMNPSVTYVANFGSRSVQWMDTARFRPDAMPMAGIDDGAVSLPDGPTDMVLAPAGDALFVALPRMGAILPISVSPSRALEQPAEADLVDLSLAVFPDPVVAPATEYRLGCATRAPNAGVSDVMALGMTPEPESLLVADDVLLVADAALPVIHRFSIGPAGALTPLSPLATGVPVGRMAVTPVVPADADGMSGMARFLYAIDATDQSVLAIDYLEASPTFGAIIPVSTGAGRSDRLDLSADARSLGILTPGFPGAPCTVANDAVSPTHLRGVFLAVGQTNGGMVLIDILDLDAGCRGGSTCDDGILFVERHRPRIGSTVTDSVSLTGTPTLTRNGSPGQLDENGNTSAELGLDVFDCPEFMSAAGSGICASSDPWTSRSESWTATYQAPFATGGRGRFDGTFEVSADDGAFCRRGVIGFADIAASGLDATVDPEAGYGGDSLVITSPPAASRIESNPECELFVDPEDGRDFVSISYRINAATPDSLSLEADVGPGFGVDNEGGTRDYAQVLRCYEGTLFRYEVRVRGAYLVSGRVSGSSHRIVADAGACRVDLSQPVTRNRIAQLGRPYVNPQVAFALRAAELTVTDESILTFGLTGAPRRVAVDVGTRGSAARRPALVERVVYNPTNARLYALDSNSDGFIEYSLSPLQADNIFE